MLLALLLGTLLLGLAAGAWPALVLSAFRPVKTLKQEPADSVGTVRNMLTGLQFAILIVLAIATIVVWQQHRYATSQGLRADIDQMLVVQNANCTAALRAEFRKLAGVAGIACSNGQLLDNDQMTGVSRHGAPMQIDLVEVDWGAFGLYDIKPLAGTFPSINAQGDADPANLSRVVLNTLAVRRLGFASPEAAIGQRIAVTQKGFPPASVVAAVVPDFAFYSVERALEPTLYRPMMAKPTAQQMMEHLDSNHDGFLEKSEFGSGSSAKVLQEADADLDGRLSLDELEALISSSSDDLVNIRLRGQAIAQTLAAIDRVWSAAGNRRPIDRFFLDAHMQELYAGMVRQAQLLTGFSGLAVSLACLGLVGIAVSTAERRTKEIGVRKAMGAGTGEVVALLLWQFAQPVLWANVIAWPVAWWLMRRWLSGFAYHVDLHWWVFAGASLGALAIALATVAGQAFLTARAKPVLALRYE